MAIQTALTKKNEIRDMLESNKKALAQALPVYIKPDAMIRFSLTALNKNIKLLDCDKASIALAILNAAECGLPIDGYHSHLVPYGRTCQFIPDYKGLVSLAYSCGVSITSSVVYEADHFEETRGLNPNIEHVPYDSMRGDQKRANAKQTNNGRGELIAAYAVGNMKDLPPVFKVMYKEEIEKRRRTSKSSSHKESPWQKWQEEMWMKTVVKSLIKMLPRNQMIVKAVELDNLAEMGERQGTLDADWSLEIPQEEETPAASE